MGGVDAFGSGVSLIITGIGGIFFVADCDNTNSRNDFDLTSLLCGVAGVLLSDNSDRGFRDALLHWEGVVQ